jgi:hypothetical protein
VTKLNAKIKVLSIVHLGPPIARQMSVDGCWRQDAKTVLQLRISNLSSRIAVLEETSSG